MKCWSNLARQKPPKPQNGFFSSSPAGDLPLKRVNPLGIQMLSRPLYEQLFSSNKEGRVNKSAVDRSIKHLREQKLWGKEVTDLPDVAINLPRLQGRNLEEHFWAIAEFQSKPYLDLAKQLAGTKLHPMPPAWSSEPGWSRYDPVTGHAERVDYPHDDVLVLDVETCVIEGQKPILAVAVSPQAWYSWTSQRLACSEDFYDYSSCGTVLDDLIPLEASGDGVKSANRGRKLHRRLVVGHSVSYDRARLKEQYLIKDSATKFLDTLSLHVCVAGQTSNQKGIWMSRKKRLSKEVVKETELDIPTRTTASHDLWMEVSSPNNLSDVHWLHVRRGKKKLDKAQRDVFIKGSVQDIRSDFQSLMRYCAEDVLCTYEVLHKVLPLFLSRCPHPATFAGMLEMGSAYLPLDSSWNEYIDDVEYTYEEMEQEMTGQLMILADDACSYLHHDRYLSSPWLCNLNWTSKKFRGKALKTKSAARKFLTSIEEFYEEQEEEFYSKGGKTGTDTHGKEEDGDDHFFICSVESMLPKRPVHLPGYPEWYRTLCMKRHDANLRPGPVNITAQTRVTPYLLRMKWEGHPLHYHSKLGWGFIISPNLHKGETPKFDSQVDLEVGAERWGPDPNLTLEQVEDLLDKNLEKMNDDKENGEEGKGARKQGVVAKKSKKTRKKIEKDSEDGERLLSEEADAKEKWSPQITETVWGRTNDIVTLLNNETYYFFKIPHKDGVGANCGNPLSKEYLPKMEDGTLTSAAGQLGQRILIVNSMISFWRSARSRILQQFVVDLKDSADPTPTDSANLFAILPQMQVAGTVTRRAVESTWLTASNAKENRVGSEVKAMVRAPPGYHLIGADVDSQELWIAAVLGDVHFSGIHGSTGVGWMTLQGSKAAGTDVHSNTANTIGISRDHAKILNYGRIYGAGLPFMELLLRKFNPSLSDDEVGTKAKTLLTATKGERMYKLKRQGLELAREMEMQVHDGGCVSYHDWKFMCSTIGYMKAMNYLIERVWVGGSESHLFNKLENIALSDLPRTPVLGCCISKALEPRYVGGSYQPSKINWVVQSSAVDYLHLMLVCTRWLFEKFDIDGRFCISIHDEVRYVVKSEDRYRAALALQITNLFTRAMFAYQLKMYDLPQSVAFFSAVDVDKVLRKEPSMDCKTPSNPHGLEKGHGISPGEALDIYQLLEKTNYSLKKSSK